MNRQAALYALIQFNEPLTRLKVALESFPWDVDNPIITLTSDNIVAILQRFTTGEFGADVLVEWANLVEGREDIQFEPDHAETISDTIFQLANPALRASLVIAVPEMISKLR